MTGRTMPSLAGDFCPANRFGMGNDLEIIGQWLQFLDPIATLERGLDQEISHSRVLGQQCSMQVTADGVVANATLGAVLPIIAASNPDLAERFRRRAEKGQAAMVLETNQGAKTITIDNHVADETLRASFRPGIEEADSRQLRLAIWVIVRSEELVAATDRQHRDAIFQRLPEHGPLFALNISRDGDLLPVLATTPEIDIDSIWIKWLPRTERGDLCLDPAPACPLGQCQYVAAISVDVHCVAVEPADRQFHGAALSHCSQNI